MRTMTLILISGCLVALSSQVGQAQSFGPPSARPEVQRLPLPPDRGMPIAPPGPEWSAPPPGDVFLIAEPVADVEDQEADPNPHAAWLGIEVAPVPPPLAAHLESGGGGLMVQNIFKGSPADKAGVQRYDVIVEANGEKVSPDVRGFTQYVKHLKPGDTLRLVYLRQGKRIEASIQMATRPGKWEDLERKYPDEPGPYDFRGRIMRRGPEGWIMEDLGPLPEPRDLPRKLWLYADRLFDKQAPKGEKEMAEGRRVDKDGNVLVVRRSEKGDIVVKRYQQKEGEKAAQVKIYPNANELKAADREAFDLLKATESVKARRVDKDGRVLDVLRTQDGMIFVSRYQQKEGEKAGKAMLYRNEKELEAADREAYDLLKDAEAERFELPVPPGWSPELRERFDEGVRRFHDRMKAYEEALKDLDKRTEDYQKNIRQWRERLDRGLRDNRWGDRWEQWRDRFFQGPFEEMRPLPPPPASQPAGHPRTPHKPTTPPPGAPSQPECQKPAPSHPGHPPMLPPPQVRFEHGTDGSIIVHLRDRDTETSRPFPSEQALKEKAPELHKQYRAMQDRFR